MMVMMAGASCTVVTPLAAEVTMLARSISRSTVTPTSPLPAPGASAVAGVAATAGGSSAHAGEAGAHRRARNQRHHGRPGEYANEARGPHLPASTMTISTRRAPPLRCLP